MSNELRLIGRLLIIIGVPFLVSVGMFVFLWNLFLVPVSPDSTEKIYVLATSDRNFKDLCKEMEKQGVVKHWMLLSTLAKIRGGNTAVRAGEYQVGPGMTPKEILEALSSGQTFKRSIEILAGMTIREVAQVMADSGLSSVEEFEKAAADRGLIARAGLRVESFEGYLFPGTYSFSKGDRISRIIWPMLERGEDFWVKNNLGERADELGFAREDTLILASIIQEEASLPADFGKVSSVLHNRLKNGMKLNSLATVRYGLEDRNAPLTEESLKQEHPFNTHLNYSLPPAPICNPGEEAVRAALYPEETTYLFFTPDNTGGLVFARTEQEYEDALRRFGSPVT